MNRRLEERLIFEGFSDALHWLAKDMLEIDVYSDGAGYRNRYTDDALMDALLIFHHVLENVTFHKMEDIKRPSQEKIKAVTQAADFLHKFIKQYCNINTKTFYKK